MPEGVQPANPLHALLSEAVNKVLEKVNPGPVLQPSAEDALIERIAEKVLAKLGSVSLDKSEPSPT